MCRILLIDDDDLVRATLALMLESAGHEAVTTSYAADALHKLRSHSFDIVLTDIYLHGTQGTELISQARYLFPEIRILAMTGGGDDILAAAERLGASGVLRKPIQRKVLLAEIERCLGLA